MPVSRGVNRSDSTTALRLGWEVNPDIEAMAPSAISSPTSAPFRMLAAWAPPISWVWKWTGRPTSWRKVLTRISAA